MFNEEFLVEMNARINIISIILIDRYEFILLIILLC